MFWVTPAEKGIIQTQAKDAGLSTSGYLRNLRLWYKPKSLIDNRQVIELAKINGDLGRLGGLLKRWLTDDARTAQFGPNVIRAALARMEEIQKIMMETMKRIVMPKSEV